MENENINTNATDTQMNSTNELKSESFANEALTANTNYGTISASDIENGTAELVLMPQIEESTGEDASGAESTLPVFDAEAASIGINSFYDGCITVAGAKVYYKFEVPVSGSYTVHSIGDIDTYGVLYDSSGVPLGCDDNSPVRSKNFRITRTLQCGTTYYLSVTANNGETGCFSIRVTDKIFVDYVSIPQTISMAKKQTIYLPNISQVMPLNADEKNINYFCTDNNVIMLSQEMVLDDDGTYRNLAAITAISVGTAVIKCYDFYGHGEVGECTVTVNDILEEDEISWQSIGFTYDSSEEDSFRQRHALSPRSYDEWIAEGRQKVVYLCDYSKIWVFGHAFLYIRIDGKSWYKTQFEPINGEYVVTCQQINETEKNSRVNDEKIDHIFLYGDYENALKKAQDYAAMDNNGYNGKYDPVFNNCLHYVNEILGYGNNINDAVDEHIHEFEGFSPNAYYNDLVRIIKQ